MGEENRKYSSFMEQESEKGTAELGVVGKEEEKGDVVMDEEKGIGGLLVKGEGTAGRDVQNHDFMEEGVVAEKGVGKGGVEEVVKDCSLMEQESEKGTGELGVIVGKEVGEGDVEMCEQKCIDGLLVKEGCVKDSDLIEGNCVGEESFKKLGGCDGGNSDRVNRMIEEKDHVGVIGNKEVEGKVIGVMSEQDEEDTQLREDKVDVEMAEVDEKDSGVKEIVGNSEENVNNSDEAVGE